MNYCSFMGRLTKDPEFHIVQNEKGEHHIARFALAVDRNFGKATSYPRFVAFGKTADIVQRYLRKGKRVVVSGELVTGHYTDRDSGKEIYTTDIYVSRVEFADNKDKEGSKEQMPPYIVPSPDADGFIHIPEEMQEELPFQ